MCVWEFFWKLASRTYRIIEENGMGAKSEGLLASRTKQQSETFTYHIVAKHIVITHSIFPSCRSPSQSPPLRNSFPFVLQCMNNKTQLHLKTVDFRQTLHGSSRQSCHSLLKSKPCPPPQRANSAHPARRQSFTKRLSGQAAVAGTSHDFIGRFSELSINRQSMRDFAKKQFFKPGAFPKRDPILKNSNAFKYYVHSTINKPQQTQPDFLADFYSKIRQAIAEHAKKEIADNQSRRKAITECSLTPYHHPRPTKAKAKRLKTQKNPQSQNIPQGGNLQPWQTSTGQQGPYLTDL